MTYSLLKRIPKNKLSLKQKSFRPTEYEDGNMLPLYKFVREPTHLDEFDWKDEMAIWRNNGTIICVCDMAFLQFKEPSVCFAIVVGELDLQCAIYGKTKASALETATLFWSLKHSEDIYLGTCSYGMHGDDKEYDFDFADLQPEQLARVLDANPGHDFVFSTRGWSPEQSTILATRSNPVTLHLIRTYMSHFAFEDEGTAFVDALESRTTSFGSLYIPYGPKGAPFSRSNLKRLLQLDVPFQKFHIDFLDKELAFLPFSLNTKAPSYEIVAVNFVSKGVENLDIVANDLSLKVYLGGTKDWAKPLVSLLGRVAKLGHFERLCFAFEHLQEGVVLQAEAVERVAKALIRAVKANPNLKHLDVSGTKVLVGWGCTLKDTCKTMGVECVLKRPVELW